jgi:pimeloyl-ACP methyl ester carboxylesterase
VARQTTHVGDLTVVIERPSAPAAKPPVLLIHGIFGGAWMWESYQSRLAQRGYESHALNLRGHHGSRPVPDIGKVSLGDYVDDALEVARTLRNPVIVGHSMGGLIAQKVAEAGVAQATVLISAAPPRWIPIVSWLLLRKQLKFIGKLLRSEPLIPDRGDMDELVFNRTPVAERGPLFARVVPDSGHAGLGLSLGTIAVNESRVTAPVLVMTGLDDQFVVPRVARALAKKYGAPLREYRSFAHQIITEPGWEGPCDDVIKWMDEMTRA